jgi:Carboxypeptidase regulatory-like domain/TonB dependent receptor
MRKFSFIHWLAVLAILSSAAFATAQTIDGTLRGEVTDPSGAVVAGAKVTATNVATNISTDTISSSSGTFNFPNMLPGTYKVTVETSGFSTYTRDGVQVRTNQVTEVNPRLAVGGTTAEVDVVTGAEVIRTDAQLVNTFDANQIVNLPYSGAAPLGSNAVLNLATLAPGTTTQSGGVLGEGGSIGGTRPRMNNFTVDGLDDNRVDITGSITNVIQDAVAEFTLITNQFSADLGHSAGGQFNVVTKSGGNDWHGTAGIGSNNRHLNAFDNIQKQAQGCYDGPCDKPRTDSNAISGTVGGPIVKDKAFIFGGYQRVFAGLQGSSTTLETPTAAGLTNLNTLASSDAVRNILAQFPTAGSTKRTISVTNPRTGVTLPVGIGEVASLAPNIFNEHDYLANGDVNLSKQQLRFRYIHNRNTKPNLSDPPLPQFSGDVAVKVHKFSFGDVWTLSPSWVNDFRAGYTRFQNSFTVPDQFKNFPNVFVNQLTNFQVGPESNSPQSSGQNVYQLIEQMSHTRGAHSFKFGGEFRRWIAPGGFLPRERGEWQYSDLSNLVSDTVPIDFAKRGAGSGRTDGNQSATFFFVQDDWKATPRLTLNLGLRYEWFGVPYLATLQQQNQISNCPSCTSQYLPNGFDFRVPKSDRNNFAPRLGFAWSPTSDAKWSLRGGFGLSYDVIAQNFPSLQLPPQLQSEQDPDITCGLPGRPVWCSGYNAATYASGGQTGAGFLAGGGLLSVNLPPTNQADARAATQGYIFDQVMPRIYTWTASLQHELRRNTSIELRYLGTKGTKMFAQTQLNASSGFDRGAQPLPTYFSNGDVPTTFAAGAPTLAAFSSITATRPFEAQGFLGPVTGFTSNAESIYHSGSVDLNQRVTRGITLRANYTWAHNIDNGTNELFSSLVNPRRAEDGNHQDHERGNSVLDVRHKSAISWTWELPSRFENSIVKGILGGWAWNGAFLLQTGQPATALSNTDSNGNKDSAGDRAIVNLSGDPTKGTDTNTVCWNGSVRSFGCTTASQIVGYVALDPTAMYVRARNGSMSNVGRNTLTSPRRTNFDMSFFKNFRFTESKYLQFRSEFFNVFNHRQFSFANPGVFAVVGIDDSAINAAGYARVADTNFLNAQQLNGGSRVINLGLKFVF